MITSRRLREASRPRVSPRGTHCSNSYNSWALRKLDFSRAPASPLPYCVVSVPVPLPVPVRQCARPASAESCPSAPASLAASRICAIAACRVLREDADAEAAADADAGADGAQRVRVNSLFRPTNPIAYRAPLQLLEGTSRGREARVRLRAH